MSFFNKINNMTILSIFEKIFERWDREISKYTTTCRKRITGGSSYTLYI